MEQDIADDVVTWTEEIIEATDRTYHVAKVAGRVIGVVNPNVRTGTVAWMSELSEFDGTAPTLDEAKADLEASFRAWLEGFRPFMDAAPEPGFTP